MHTREYVILYYVLIAIFFCWGALYGIYKPSKEAGAYSRIAAICFLLLISLLFGFRSIDVGTDTQSYFELFSIMKSYSNISDFYNDVRGDYLFITIMYGFAKFFNYSSFLLLISLLTAYFQYIYIDKVSEKGRKFNFLLLVLFLSSLFSMPSIFVNIIRNGLAITILLIFSYYLLLNDRKRIVIWGGLALLGHHTIIIPMIMMIAVKYLIKVDIKWFYFLYIIVLCLSILNVGIHQISFLAELGIDKVNNYIFYEETNYKIGFRLDFALFNTFFALLFYFFYRKTKQYEFYLKYYLLSSCLFFFWFHIPFSDRMGLYSWIVIPILSFLGVNYKFHRKRQKYLYLMFLFLYTVNISLALR